MKTIIPVAALLLAITTPATAQVLIGHAIESRDGAEIAVVADVNRDGWDDIVYTSWNQSKILLLENQKYTTYVSQNFVVSEIASGVTQARNLHVADVLDNGEMGVFVSAWGAGHFLYRKVGGVWIGVRVDVEDTTNYGASGIVAGFLNGDNLPDIVTATRCNAELPSCNNGANSTVKVYHNMSTAGTWSRSLVQTFTVSNPSHVAIVDVDGDGLNDVVASDADGAVWWRYVGNFVFASAARIANGLGGSAGGASKILPVDLNRDGTMDYVVPSHSTGLYWVDGKQLGVAIAISTNHRNGYHVAAGTLNDPYHIDVAFVSAGSYGPNPPDSNNDSFWIFRQQDDGTFLANHVSGQGAGTPDQTWRSVAIGDFLHNGRLHLVTTQYNADRIDWWENTRSSVP